MKLGDNMHKISKLKREKIGKYEPYLNLPQTEKAIRFIKSYFQEEIAEKLNLSRVSAPIVVSKRSGLNDYLSGIEEPIRFFVKSTGEEAEIVQSLAKWKRNALYEYNSIINQTQRNIIESYLAAKYALTVTSDKYGSHPGYHYDIAGIGIESSTDFHIDAMSVGMLRLKDPVGLDNGDYLLIGHDDTDYTTWTSTETPVDSLKRIEREWYVSETNDITSLTIAWKEDIFHKNRAI